MIKNMRPSTIQLYIAGSRVGKFGRCVFLERGLVRRSGGEFEITQKAQGLVAARYLSFTSKLI